MDETTETGVAQRVISTPLGPYVAVATEAGLQALSWGDAAAGATGQWSPRAVTHLELLEQEMGEYFSGSRRSFTVPIVWNGTTGFGRTVLEVAAGIPFGSTMTYAEIAAAAGSPRGARAAGNALGRNPVPILVPCHRVVASSGGLGGYTGGLDKKRFLLKLEGAL